MVYCHRWYVFVILTCFHGVHGDVQLVSNTFGTVWQQAMIREQLHAIPAISNFTTTWRTADRASPPRLSDLCQKHINFYNLNLRLGQMWALSMYDSSTKTPEGIMGGAWVHMGSFDECLRIKVPFANDDFLGKHCMASLSIDTSVLGNASTDTRFGSRALPEDVMELLKQVVIKVAACIPSSCNTTDVEEYVKTAMTLPAFIKVNVPELECHVDSDPEFQLEDWLCVGILSFFAIIIILSTTYDVVYQRSESRCHLLTSFSVYTNGKKLLKITSNEGQNLNSLHGIRLISMAWVVLGHRYIMSASSPSNNVLMYLPEFIKDWKRLWLTNATLSVDTFFVLSGFLVSYVFLREVKKTESFNILHYLLHRYIRLTPALAIVILLYATLLRYAGSGPLWDVTISPLDENCHNYWWPSLLYIQNYYKPMNMCLGHSWYLAADMQMYWLSPVVLIPLWKWPKVGTVLVCALAIGGIIADFMISYNNLFPASLLKLTVSDQTQDFIKYLYFPAHTRFVPYLIGMFLAFFILRLGKDGSKLKLSVLSVLMLWAVTATSLLASLCLLHPFQQPGYVKDRVAEAFFNSLDRPLWSFGVAMVIFLCYAGYGGYVNTLLSWDWFQPLSRLSYTVYLVHMSVQTSQTGSIRTLSYLSDINTIPQFGGDLLISIVFAAVLSLAFEAPFIALEKNLLDLKRNGRNKNILETASPGPQQES